MANLDHLKDKWPEIRDNIEWSASNRKGEKREKKTVVSRMVIWFLKRYLEYMWDAIFNGYPIRVKDVVHIFIEMEPIRALNDIEKRTWRVSTKCSDYIFRIAMRGRYFDDDYTFIPNKKLMQRFEETINSDMVFKFIKDRQ